MKTHAIWLQPDLDNHVRELLLQELSTLRTSANSSGVRLGCSRSSEGKPQVRVLPAVALVTVPSTTHVKHLLVPFPITSEFKYAGAQLPVGAPDLEKRMQLLAGQQL